MKKLVFVETISMHRIRYCIELEDVHDIDTLDLPYSHELSQKHIVETITSHREISEKEYLKIFDEDNDYLKHWTDEQKLKYIYRNEK